MNKFTIGDHLKTEQPIAEPYARVLEKTLEVGQWKIGFDSAKGRYVPGGVYLIGMRNRPFPLLRTDVDEFKTRMPFDRNGNPVESPFVLRGVPVAYYSYSNVIYVWPAAAHRWRLQIKLRERKAAYDRTLYIWGLHQVRGAVAADPDARRRAPGGRYCAAPHGVEVRPAAL